MILKRVEIANYRVFIDESFDFSENCVNYIVGSNGSGKSSLFYAIEWCFGIDRCRYIYGRADRKINDKIASNIADGEDVTIRVAVTYFDDEFGLIKIIKEETVVKKDGIFEPKNNKTEVYRIDKTGKEIIARHEKEEIIDRARRCILVIDPNEQNSFPRDLINFMRNKYFISKETSYNLLEQILQSANKVFKQICKKKYLDIYLNKETEKIEFKQNDTTVYVSASEYTMCIHSILIALKQFDNEILLISDGLNRFDVGDGKLFFNYLSLIKKQVFFVLYYADIDLLQIKDNLYGYIIDKQDDRLSASVRSIKNNID